MDTASKIGAGRRIQEKFTLQEAYDGFLRRAAVDSREVAVANGYQGEQIEQAVDAALTVLRMDLPGDFFERFAGEFIVHRPSVGEMIQIDNMAALLNNHTPEQSLRTRGKDLAHMIATLKLVVDDAPSWWGDPLNLFDTEPIQIAYWGFKTWLDSFRRGVLASPPQAQDGSG